MQTVTTSGAIASDGTAWSWGQNSNGQLGNVTTTTSTTAVQVQLPEGRNVAAVAAGRSHSLAITSDSTLWAWGSNNFGQLGYGSRGTTDAATPMDTLPGGRTVTAVPFGHHHSLAIASDGTAWAWGRNGGQLGNGTTADSAVPVQVVMQVEPECLAGAVPLDDGEFCTLAADTAYTYALTTRDGGWSVVSAPLVATTGAPSP